MKGRLYAVRTAVARVLTVCVCAVRTSHPSRIRVRAPAAVRLSRSEPLWLLCVRCLSTVFRRSPVLPFCRSAVLPFCRSAVLNRHNGHSGPVPNGERANDERTNTLCHRLARCARRVFFDHRVSVSAAGIIARTSSVSRTLPYSCQDTVGLAHRSAGAGAGAAAFMGRTFVSSHDAPSAAIFRDRRALCTLYALLA